MVAIILILAAYLGGLLFLLTFMRGAGLGRDGPPGGAASHTFALAADDGETGPL